MKRIYVKESVIDGETRERTNTMYERKYKWEWDREYDMKLEMKWNERREKKILNKWQHQ